ncbi:hypothetical protein D3C84_852790 [compost metagenome]
MSIVEHLQAVGLQLNQGGQFQREACRGLPGVAVAQIDTHRAVVKGACGIDQRIDRRRVLVAVLRQLAALTDIRHADADMIETLIAQQPHGRPCGVVKIDIDAVVAALMGEKVEALVQLGH